MLGLANFPPTESSPQVPSNLVKVINFCYVSIFLSIYMQYVDGDRGGAAEFSAIKIVSTCGENKLKTG